jgi:putrescine aminotransferase
MRLSTKAVLASSKRYLDLIGGAPMNESEMHAFIGETVDSYEKHVNRGFISYRKSVTEAGQFAALEWAGNGSTITDLLGREYIDCLGGYGIFSAGINHPRIVKAVSDQMRRMALNSQELLEPWRAALAKLIAEITPGDLACSFFINNGTDAVEGAIKLARLHTGRHTFLSTLGGFHGKSMGSLALMGKASFREPFRSGLQDVRFAPYGDANALEAEFAKAATVGTPIAAFMVEPIQGEAGAVVPPPGYLARARELCDQYGALLIADEIQTGMGRTGRLWGVDHADVVPDIMCLGKALGGGVMPLSAFVSTPKIWEALVSNPARSRLRGRDFCCRRHELRSVRSARRAHLRSGHRPVLAVYRLWYQGQLSGLRRRPHVDAPGACPLPGCHQQGMLVLRLCRIEGDRPAEGRQARLAQRA